MKKFLVLIKSEYTRDIQAFTGMELPQESDEIYHDSEFDYGWKDAEGDVLVAELSCLSKDEALKRVYTVYSDASPEIFRIIEVTV